MSSSLKTLNTGIQGDVFQYVIAYMVPAAVASAPFAVWLIHKNPEAIGQLRSLEWFFSAVGVLLLTAIGVLLYEAGSLIEIRWLDRRMDHRTKNQHGVDWKKYLMLQLSDEHLGRRYISRLVVFLRFELSSLVAFPLAIISFFLCFRSSGTPTWVFVLVPSIGVAGFLLVLWAARVTHEALSDIRSQIVNTAITGTSAGRQA